VLNVFEFVRTVRQERNEKQDAHRAADRQLAP
jgi:hypothetical protein